MQQHDILINWSPQETRVAVVEDGAVQELHIERTLERGLVGNIYLGRVSRVLPGMQSAFVDIGLERTAFLHVADVWRPFDASAGDVPVPPIEHQVFAGQTLMVQVIKDPIGAKGARLSTQISIAGRLLVFLPQDDHIGISQKIPLHEREALRERVQALACESVAADGEVSVEGRAPRHGGFILRTNGEDASDDELRQDIAYLRTTWAHIRAQAIRLSPGSLLYHDLDLVQRVLRDMVGPDTQHILIDSRMQYAQLLAFGQTFTPQAVRKLRPYQGAQPIFDLYAIDAEITRALDRRVPLKSGGYLIIDQTEAMTTIDVNTGGFVGGRSFEDTIFKTNLEAAQAIARQLRLRNLGGIIIVDFIDMAQNHHREQVLLELKRQLQRDRVKTMTGSFSQLGLLEMTRKRTRESLLHMLSRPCPVCEGRGSVKTVRSVCYEILREILREARQFSPQQFRIVAHPDVVELLLGEESQHLAGLSDFIGKPIAVQPEAEMGPQDYDIVLI